MLCINKFEKITDPSWAFHIPYKHDLGSQVVPIPPFPDGRRPDREGFSLFGQDLDARDSGFAFHGVQFDEDGIGHRDALEALDQRFQSTA